MKVYRINIIVKKDISEKLKNLSLSLNQLIKNSDEQNFRVIEMLSVINHKDKVYQDKIFEALQNADQAFLTELNQIPMSDLLEAYAISDGAIDWEKQFGE